jgi:hypothetical protein
MFDFFLSTEKKIQKHQRRVVNRDAQAEDREMSCRYLSDEGSAKALRCLLTRFDMNLPHQLNDTEEKEMVYAMLLQHGADLAKPLRVHLKKCKKFAMPIRMLEELEGELAAVEMVFALIEAERVKDDFKPEKKTNMLIWLTEKVHPGCIEVALPHLKDFDEGVRYAAAEVLIAQQDDAARLPLLETLANPDDDSNRLRVRLCEVFVQRRWPIDGLDPKLLAAGFALRDGRVVRA